MRRGSIWLADLDPVRGSEANKRRPVVVVSNDRLSAQVQRSGRGVLTVVPLTSNVEKVYSFQVLVLAAEVTSLSMDSKAQAEQVRAVDVSRFQRRLGAVTGPVLAELEQALRLHLSL